MRITPLDVRKQEFRRVVRGLDADEVYAFLTTVADEYEACLSDNKQLREKVIDLDEKVSEYRNMETTLRDTLLTAERVMSEARQNARKEAELILRDATVKANGQTANIAAEVEALKNQLRELRGQRDGFLARLQSLAESQVRLVESFRKDFENEDAERSAQRASAFAPAPAPVDRAEPNPPEVAPVSAEDPLPPRSTDPVAEVTEAIAQTGASTTPAAADEWRDYSFGASQGPAVDASPIAIDDSVAETPEPAGSELEVNQEIDSATALLEEEPIPTSAYESEWNGESSPVAVSTPPAAPPVETGVDDLVDASEEDPVDRIARMMAEAAAPEVEFTTGGHDEYAMAPSPDSVTGDAEGEAEANGGSKWSLSRFTKGLANF